MEDVKLIPYGVSDFKQVRKENLYYSDKTMFLERMERAGHFLFLTRPRRFGKSIYLSMMRAYVPSTPHQLHFNFPSTSLKLSLRNLNIIINRTI